MSALAGTGSLVRLALRRDRVILPIWIVIFAGMAWSSAGATTDLYPTAASRAAAVMSMNAAPALVALYGYVYSASIGALSLIKMTSTGAAALAVLAFMLVIRHTRAEEEAGRLELIGATAIGRSAAMTAAVVVSAGTCILIGVLSTIGLMSSGLPTEGSIAFGLAWAATGCAFAAVGALAAQLTSGGRSAIGISSIFLGLAYFVRAIGDTTGHDNASWLSWLSPIGWEMQVRPFAHERWPALLLLVAFAVVTGSSAYVLAHRRDLGAGLLADRPGPAVGSRRLSGAAGLAWRLHRGTVISWAAAIVMVGAIIGSIASQIGGMLDSPAAKEFITKLGGSHVLTDAYLALELGAMGAIVSIFGMQAVMRMRQEEVAWRTDIALATATSRSKWLASHVVMAVAGTAGLILIGGLASGMGDALQVGDAGQFGRILGGAAVQIPAALVMTGIVVATFGLWPRLTTATWGLLVAFMLLGQFGTIFNLPSWVMDLSPFAHTPRIPGSELQWAPLVAMSAIAIALIGVGFVAFRRRDIG